MGATTTAAISIISKPAIEHPTTRQTPVLLKGDLVRFCWAGSHGDAERFWYDALEQFDRLRLNFEFMLRSFVVRFLALFSIAGQLSAQSARDLRYPFDFAACYAASRGISAAQTAFPDA